MEKFLRTSIENYVLNTQLTFRADRLRTVLSKLPGSFEKSGFEKNASKV